MAIVYYYLRLWHIKSFKFIKLSPLSLHEKPDDYEKLYETETPENFAVAENFLPDLFKTRAPTAKNMKRVGYLELEPMNIAGSVPTLWSTELIEVINEINNNPEDVNSVIYKSQHIWM